MLPLKEGFHRSNSMNVGAVTNRPRSKDFRIRRNRCETAAVFRRAIDDRPYDHKTTKYADVVELVDSLDLGAVTLVKVFLWMFGWFRGKN